MEKIITIVLTLVMAVASNSFAGKIPEAKKLHPELYTIQFTFARFPTCGIEMDDKERKCTYEEYEFLLEELMESDDYKDLASDERELAHALLLGRVRQKGIINHIESCKEVEYKDLATIYTSSGEPFPEAYSNVVKGSFDSESNTLVLSELKSETITVMIKTTRPHFYVNEWSSIVTSSGGGNNNGHLLVKCYPPTNVSSNQTSENKD